MIAVTPQESTRLRETIVKEAIQKLSWQTLEQHLETLPFNFGTAVEIIEILKHSSDFVLKHPNKTREIERAAFLQSLSTFFDAKAGSDASARLADALNTFKLIESGYQKILKTLASSEIAQLPPAIQASAALKRIASAIHEIHEAVTASVKRGKDISLQSFRVNRGDGTSYSPDGVVDAAVSVATKTLVMLSYQYSWLDTQNFVILPNMVEVTEMEINKSSTNEYLAVAWRNWERIEQRCRYFGGKLAHFLPPNLPDWVPEKIAEAFEYSEITDDECFDFWAVNRLNDGYVQNFTEMKLFTNVQEKARGIAHPIDFSPTNFVSVREVQAQLFLAQTLGYAIHTDEQRILGLRLVEWVRGYSTLQCLVEEQYEHGEAGDLLFEISRDVFVQTLVRVGFTIATAEIFIDRTSLRASSRDLFDQPLIRLANGSLLVFGPAVLGFDPARVALSALGNQGAQLTRKGQSFEKYMIKLFRDHGLSAQSFKTKWDGEEFEYDVVLPWEDNIFIFECKNRTLSGSNPVAAYYFAQETRSAAKQVKRLANAVIQNASEFKARTGIEVTGKKIVPCVVYSFPYSRGLADDGVCICDASGIKRFFEGKFFHVSRELRVRGSLKKILQRVPLLALWKNDTPTSDDLLVACPIFCTRRSERLLHV